MGPQGVKPRPATANIRGRADIESSCAPYTKSLSFLGHLSQVEIKYIGQGKLKLGSEAVLSQANDNPDLYKE
jgi:hypothetical protein